MPTDWFLPPLKPVRAGYYESTFFDCGWAYEWKVWWATDRQVWLDKEGGLTLAGQNLTWRGLEKQDDEQL
jgi:hypothetical protein